MTDPRLRADIDAAIREELGPSARVVASEATLKDDLGLSSLAIMEAATRLAKRLLPAGRHGELSITDVRTVGDLTRSLWAALAKSDTRGESEPIDAALAASMARGRGRRQVRR